MPDSLVLANTVEVLNGSPPSVNPSCPGARFYLQPSGDFGAPQPTTDFVASLLLDGERPFGRRASNRTIKLPIWITAPNRQLLAAAREVLEQAIDQDYYTITWTRDPTAGNAGGAPLPLIFDCFRAQPTVATFNTKFEKQLAGMQVEVTIPALPYGRSATQSQVSFSSPVPANPAVPPPPAPVVLDTFSTISSVQCSQSNQCVVGPYTCCWDPDAFGDYGGQQTPLTYGASFSAPLNLTGLTSLQMWFGLGSRYYANLEFHGKTHGVGLYFTLTDNNGVQLSFSRGNLILPVSNSAQSPVFTRVTVGVPQGNTVFNYANVVSYSLTVINRSDRIPRLSWVTAYIDNLTAQPGSQYVSPVTRGAVYTIYGVQGTARAPVSMSFQQPPSPGTVTTVTAAGPGSYTVPVNATYLKAEATGGGGAGAGMTAAGVGAGGRGGEYAAEPAVPRGGGAGDPLRCRGGRHGGGIAARRAGDRVRPGTGRHPPGHRQRRRVRADRQQHRACLAGHVANSVEYPGGAGRANPAGTYGGGGGSSGGSSSAGNTPMGSGSVTFTATGTTMWTCPPGVTQVQATPTGAGGGGGCGSATGNGHGGGGGEVRIGLIPVTPGNSYPVVVGTGGGGGTCGGNGSGGSQSSFTGDSSAAVIAHGGGGGPATRAAPRPTGGPGGIGRHRVQRRPRRRRLPVRGRRRVVGRPERRG